MNKELNILQAIEMPVGTIFKGINTFNKEREVVIKENKGRKKLFVINKNVEPKEIELNDFTAKFKFIPIQKPVSFIEALEASKEGKRLRVVHDAYCETKEFKKIGKLFEMIISANKNFGDEIVNKAIIENILNGEWYIEEEN